MRSKNPIVNNNNNITINNNIIYLFILDLDFLL